MLRPFTFDRNTGVNLLLGCHIFVDRKTPWFDISGRLPRLPDEVARPSCAGPADRGQSPASAATGGVDAQGRTELVHRNLFCRLQPDLCRDQRWLCDDRLAAAADRRRALARADGGEGTDPL